MNFKTRVLKKYNSKTGALCLCMAVLFLFCSFHIRKDDPKRKVKVIVIDPGHGGKDPGCNGVTHREKDVALAVALKFGKLIEEKMKDVKVIYTRKTDVFVELEDRAKIANDNNADLFISIHCNAAGKPVMIKDKKTGKLRPKTFKNSKGKTIVVETANPEPYGAETYVMGLKNEEGKMKVAQRENSAILLEDNYETKYQGFDPNSEESYIIMSNYTSSYVIQSAGLALKIQEQYAKKAGRVDKGVHRQSIWVLWRTSMPSVLTEIGYLTNPQEEKFLGSEKGQEYLAACLFRAFRKYKDEQEGIRKTYDDDIENQKALEGEVYKAAAQEDKEDVVVEESEDTTNDEPKEEKPVVEKEKKQPEEKVPEKKDSVKLTLNKPKQEEIPVKVIEDKQEVSKEDIIKNYKDKIKKDTVAKTEKIPVKTEVTKQDIVFKVQFATMEKEVDVNTKFPGVQDVWFYKMGTAYKYTSGNFTSFTEATKHQSKMKDLGFKDCFVAAFRNGQRMDINEAKKQTETK